MIVIAAIAAIVIVAGVFLNYITKQVRKECLVLENKKITDEMIEDGIVQMQENMNHYFN